MPNWCFTEIIIQHSDKGKLNDLTDKIRKWTSHNAVKNGFGEKWLGNIVLNSGVGTVATGTSTDLHCRGSVDNIKNDGEKIILDTLSAYVPMLRMWLKVLEKYLPDATLKYTAEELGCSIFWTNDETLAGTYFLDSESKPFSDSNDMSEDGLVKLFQADLGTTEDNLETLIEMAEEKYPDTLRVRKWEYIPAEELD